MMAAIVFGLKYYNDTKLNRNPDGVFEVHYTILQGKEYLKFPIKRKKKDCHYLGWVRGKELGEVF